MSTFPEFSTSDTKELSSILDWVRWGASRFSESGLYFGHGTSSAWEEALYLMMWSIEQPWDMFDKLQHAKLTTSEKEKIYTLFVRRIEERIPAPYLTGVAWFAGYPYKVTQDVLIPRSPIAELILKRFEPWLREEQHPERVLDLCTGSGCIGIACAHEFEYAHVDMSDISEAALKVAEQNVAFHQLEDRTTLYQSDGFEALEGQSYDIIVSNPPYVDAEDFASMPEEFHREPELGLVSGDDGLNFARHILQEAPKHLNDGGLLIVEVGNSWVALEQAFPHIAFTWPEFEHGGHGVFVLTKEELVAQQA